MSLSWPERWRVVVSPGAVAVARGRAFGRSTALRVLSCEANGEAPHWQICIDTLAAQAEWKARSTVSVILSNRFCRFLVMDRPQAIATDSEAFTYAKHRMQSVHGAASGDWDLVLCASGRDRLLACSVPGPLLTGLRELCARRKARLESIQPFFSAAWSRRARSMSGRSGWFVVHEPRRIVAGFVSNGRWLHLASRKCGDSLDDVLDVLDRERELLAAQGLQPTVWLYGPALTSAAGEHRGYTVRPVAPPRQGEVALGKRILYAMAA